MNGFYWIFLVLFFVAAAGIVLGRKDDIERLYYMACAFLVVLFVSQDRTVGADVAAYVNEFSKIRQLPWGELINHRWEFGYVLLNKLTSTLFLRRRTIVFVMSLFILLPIFRWIKNESTMPLMSLLVFVACGYYSMALGIYRQLSAMAILTYSHKYVTSRRPVPFVLVVLLASLFHRTAIIFAVVYIIYMIPINKITLICSGICSIFLGLLGTPIMHFLNQFARIPEQAGFSGGVTMSVVLWVFVLLCWGTIQHRLSDRVIKLQFVMLLSAAVIQPISFTFSIWYRIVVYFSIAFVLLIPEIYKGVCMYRENHILRMVKRKAPVCYKHLMSLYGSLAWNLGTYCAFSFVLFLWMALTLDGMTYIFAAL